MDTPRSYTSRPLLEPKVKVITATCLLSLLLWKSEKTDLTQSAQKSSQTTRGMFASVQTAGQGVWTPSWQVLRSFSEKFFDDFWSASAIFPERARDLQKFEALSRRSPTQNRRPDNLRNERRALLLVAKENDGVAEADSEILTKTFRPTRPARRQSGPFDFSRFASMMPHFAFALLKGASRWHCGSFNHRD